MIIRALIVIVGINAGLFGVLSNAKAQIISHPVGCPHRAFFGCGAAVELFGQPIRALWRAAAWFKFPQTPPAARRAAVRTHHVFVLLEHRRGDVWLVKDFNSGGHLSRIHERSISGYRIVNPRGAA